MVVLLTTGSLEGQHLAKSFFNTGLLGAAGSSAPSDDQFNRVSFLSHFEGSNNGVNDAFDDSSSNNHTISNTGSPTQGSFGPFARPDGEWGVDFPADQDMLTVPTSTDLNLGTGDFTLECFIFVQNPEDNGGIMSKRDNQGGFNNSYRTSYRTGSKKVSFAMSAGSVDILSPVVEKGIWTHIAVVRNSGTLSIYAAGVQGDTATSNTADVGSTWPFTIGSQYQESGASPQFSFIGQISNVRFVKGTAVYSGSSFTPPTGKLTAITNTKLLTCQSNRFIDNSASGHTLTPTGNPAVTAFGPFLTKKVYDATVNGASSQLGATNYVSIPDGSWNTLGTGDFTWEYWIYPIAENNYQLGSGSAGTNASSTFTLGMSGKRLLLYYSIVGGEAYPLQSPDSAPYYNNNEWHHLAYVRSGNDHKIYANGVLRATETRSGTMVDSTAALNIGNFGPGYVAGAEGIYSDVRLVKGTAVYSGSTYTVPTAPLTAISNTELLVNFKDGQAIDSAAQNNLTLYGNAKISTGQAKFGNTSMVFDGTGDYVTLPSSSFKPFGTGDFTIECFARFDAINGKGLFQLGASYLPSAVTGPAVFASIATNNPWRIYYGTSDVDASVSPSANTWYHVAYVRSSGVTKLYVDGTSVISQNDTTNYTNTFFVIGGGYSSSFLMDGYIDDFRISHMARYTSNFTAPSEPFADKGQ